MAQNIKFVSFFGGPHDGEKIPDAEISVYCVPLRNPIPEKPNLCHVYVWAVKFNHIGYHYRGVIEMDMA